MQRLWTWMFLLIFCCCPVMAVPVLIHPSVDSQQLLQHLRFSRYKPQPYEEGGHKLHVLVLPSNSSIHRQPYGQQLSLTAHLLPSGVLQSRWETSAFSGVVIEYDQVTNTLREQPLVNLNAIAQQQPRALLVVEPSYKLQW
ncbi:hypothetical protein [Shewanella sp. Isolate11]|uniref:hypothetical protein n=1 Tax=Shewanella sp. Isolate11 TaxID=2908530 RepID=UPI001EFD7DE9|nr:hypothetical protein [Shewanella sp. Isolate11]MCG9695613.1 hypothetical protein [Shewanella sp. Isolate11]